MRNCIFKNADIYISKLETGYKKAKSQWYIINWKQRLLTNWFGNCNDSHINNVIIIITITAMFKIEASLSRDKQEKKKLKKHYKLHKDWGHTNQRTAVSKALFTIAFKHWSTAGNRSGVFRYSKTQQKALLDAVTPPPPLRIPPLLLKRIISRKATARR